MKNEATNKCIKEWTHIQVMVKTKLPSTLGLHESRGHQSQMLPLSDNQFVHLPFCPAETATEDKQTHCCPSKAAYGCQGNLM